MSKNLTCVGFTLNKPADQATSGNVDHTLPSCPTTSASDTFGGQH